ncbi:MAG: hypothetical protein IJ498_08310 [Akkermansia sp.]|nr:hypothetical protein [Akkermansia sp.]
MAIRIREWGMLSYPGRGVQIPLHGIATIDEPATRLGRVIEGAAQWGAELASQQETVTTAGNLAEFAGRLRSIEEEARAEIDMQNVRDWKYAWKQASESRLAEAIDELPPESREAGRHLAAVYNAQASATARRDYELGRIGLARHRWQSQVDEAVERGAADEAEQWIKAGEQLFVPQPEVETRTREARSRSLLNRWKEAFRQNASDALLELQKETAELPLETRDREELLRLRNTGFREVCGTLASDMSTAVEAGHEPPAGLVEKARAIGLINASDDRNGSTAPPRPACDWNRRIDECPEEEEAEARLKLDIISAPLPLPERRKLLQRMHRNRDIPAATRNEVSRRLWNLYRSGRLGCPEDIEAQQHLARLQELALTAQHPPAEPEQWIERVRPKEETWICYQPN